MTADLASGGVTIVGIGHNLVNPTFILNSALADTDVGTPVTYDGTNTMQVKKSADGDIIDGILQSYESDPQTGEKRGAVALTGGFRLRYKTSDTVAVGDSVVSAASGEVKTTATPNRTRVLKKDTTAQTVDIFLGFGVNHA